MASTASDWSAVTVHNFIDPSGCQARSERLADVSEVLQNGTFRLRTYSYRSGTCCVYERYNEVVIETTRLLDFSPYKTARFKAELRMYMERAIPPGCGAEIEIGVCGADPVSERLCGGDYNAEVTVTKTFDVNISDVVNCFRGSALIRMRVGGWCGSETPSDNEVYVEVRNLRIVVTR